MSDTRSFPALHSLRTIRSLRQQTPSRRWPATRNQPLRPHPPFSLQHRQRPVHLRRRLMTMERTINLRLRQPFRSTPKHLQNRIRCLIPQHIPKHKPDRLLTISPHSLCRLQMFQADERGPIQHCVKRRSESRILSGSGGVEARTLSGQRRAALCRTNVTALQEMV
jgi:hypothetical protein